jgi:hypothetical protein
MAAGSFFVYRAIVEMTDRLGVAGAAMSTPIYDWALLIPPIAAQRAMFEAATGGHVAAVIYLGAATAGLLTMAVVWRRLLNWMLTTPSEGSRPAARARSRGMATGPWGVIPTLARKELRFYVRDPRQRLVWTGTVIFVGLAVAGTVMGSTGFFDLRDNDWAPLMAPVLVLFVGLPIALNLFGWERNAASYLFVLPLKSRHILLGKNAAVAIGLTLVVQLGGIYMPFFNQIFNTNPLTFGQLVLCLALSSVVLIAVEIEKFFIRRGVLK